MAIKMKSGFVVQNDSWIVYRTEIYGHNITVINNLLFELKQKLAELEIQNSSEGYVYYSNSSSSKNCILIAVSTLCKCPKIPFSANALE